MKLKASVFYKGSSGIGGGGGGTAKTNNGAERTAEYAYEKLIGNGRTVRSELDRATTSEEVARIENKAKAVINNDKSIDKQGKTALIDATNRRVNEANVRVAPVSNKKEMTSFIKEQVGVDITPYIEERAGHPRSYLGVHLEDMPKAQETKVRNLMQKKGVRIEYNGGFGYTLTYIKKK